MTTKSQNTYLSFKLDTFTFRDIEKFAPQLNSVKELTLPFAESFFVRLKSKLKNYIDLIKNITKKNNLSTKSRKIALFKS
jgi:hypothetical protein